MKSLKNFDESLFGFSGEEAEILTLAPQTCVSSGITMPYALKIMSDCIPNYSDQKKIQLVSSVINHSNQNDPEAIVPVFTTMPIFLPDEENFDTVDGKLYTIVFYKIHAILVEVDFDKLKISFMDSLPEYLSDVEKKIMFNDIRAVLRERYFIVDWDPGNNF